MKLERRKALNKPISWSKADQELLLNYLKRELFDAKKLGKLFPNRTLPSIRSKVRKLRIKHDLFGSAYRDDKEDFTIKISKIVKPKIVFDAYAGAGHQTFKWIEQAEKVFASEKMKSKLSQFEKSAKKNGFVKKNTNGNFWQLYVKEGKEIYFFYWRCH